jgi:MFS family permease
MPTPMNDHNATDARDEQDRSWLNRTVVGAGLTSALGDLCYETTTVILPGFLAVLGLPAAVLGIVEGVADAVASFTKMVSGYLSDKFGHRKALVLLGYAFTPLGQALIAMALGWPLVLAGRVVSWFGKGLRGPLRDAIVVQAITPRTRGRALGFHRAMDTLGAVVGPLLGVALLAWAGEASGSNPADPFRLVLWLSVVPGVLAVLTFLALVHDPESSPNPALSFFTTIGGLPTSFKRYVGAVGVFGVGDFSHGLLILAATVSLTPSMGTVQAAQVAGLLYVGRNVTQALASYPIGVLADRHGSLPVLVVGYALGALTAALTALAFLFHLDQVAVWGTIFLAAGLYVAAQDTLESAVTTELVAADRLGTGLGTLGTVNGVAKFLSSALVGTLWTVVSPLLAFGLAAALMTLGTVTLAWVRSDRRA